MTTLDLIAKKLALAEAATPGQWEHKDTDYSEWAEVCSSHVEYAAPNIVCQHVRPKNAAFIAEARTGYPATLAALRVAVELLERNRSGWHGDGEFEDCTEECEASCKALASIDKILEGAK